jgi:GNAT superfamily N-acetyltransferase
MIEIKPLTEITFSEFAVMLEEINEEPLASETLERLKAGFDQGLYGGFLLYEDTGLAGMAAIVDSYSVVHARKILQLDELYVRKDFRRKGLGKTLFDYVIEHARKEGYLRLEWRTAKDNIESQGLYSQYETETGWIYYLLNL